MRQGRADEYAEFAVARAGHLYRSACLLTAGDTHLAEDLVQETFGRLYVRWGRVSRVGNPAGYAQTVLTRTFLAHQRRRSSRERATDVFPDLPGAGDGDASLRLRCWTRWRGCPPGTGPWSSCGTGRTGPSRRPPTS